MDLDRFSATASGFVSAAVHAMPFIDAQTSPAIFSVSNRSIDLLYRFRSQRGSITAKSTMGLSIVGCNGLAFTAGIVSGESLVSTFLRHRTIRGMGIGRKTTA